MKTLPRIRWKAYSVEKFGNSPAENEDAFYPEVEQQVFSGLGHFTCSIADGATQTSFARIWARLLVEKTAADYPDGGLIDRLTAAQQAWKDAVSEIPLPWHAEEKVRQGAFATLLWFGLKPSARLGKSGGKWNALAVGDSCLFQLRKGLLNCMFPLMNDFNNSPMLLSSQPLRNVKILDQVMNSQSEGSWLPGDEFLLMTDAAAAWFCREMGEIGLNSLQSCLFQAMQSQETYQQWIQGLRAAGKMKNDDTTILWMQV